MTEDISKEITFSNNDDGRVGRLDDNTQGYYRRVCETLETIEEEEKEFFLQNVFTQLCSEALEVSQNQTASKVVETLVAHATNAQARSLLTALYKDDDWTTAVTDRFASHVTQSTLMRAACTVQDETCKQPSLAHHMKSMFDLFTEDLPEYAMHVYASHVIRTLLEVTSGVSTAPDLVKKRSHYKEIYVTHELLKPSKEMTNLFVGICEKLFSMPKLREHACHFMTSPLIQTVLLCVKASHPNLYKPICDQLISRTNLFEITEEAINNVPDLLTDRCGSHLVEQLLVTAHDSAFDALLVEHFQPHLVAMSVDPNANFVLQRLIQQTRTPEQYTLIYKAIIDHMDQMIRKNCSGILVKLAEMSLKHGTRQKKFIKSLMKQFDCYEPEERRSKCITCLLSFKKYDLMYSRDENAPLNSIIIHGSLLLQQLLKFGDATPLTSSLLSLRARDLVYMCCDVSGCHIIDVFLASETVGAATRRQFLDNILPEVCHLATSKCGSRVLDKMWKCFSDLKSRVSIADVLSRSEHLRTHSFGRYSYMNFGINNYKNRRRQWEIVQKDQLSGKKKDVINTPLKSENSVGDNSNKRKFNNGDKEDDKKKSKNKKKKFERFQKKNRKETA